LADNSNPFDQIYRWAKGEIYDIYAMKEAIETRDAFIDQKYKHDQRKHQCEEDILKMNSGK
jgi:hypothetical protein